MEASCSQARSPGVVTWSVTRAGPALAGSMLEPGARRAAPPCSALAGTPMDLTVGGRRAPQSPVSSARTHRSAPGEPGSGEAVAHCRPDSTRPVKRLASIFKVVIRKQIFIFCKQR